jgi:signal transduction histidine kinase
VASAPSEPGTVVGRVDAQGHLIAADPELEALQLEAGSRLGEPLALPQIAAVAQLARKLGTTVSRRVVAASADKDIELSVRATPQGEETLLNLEGWTARAAAGPRLAAIAGGSSDPHSAESRHEWATDEELRLISISSELAEVLGVDVEQASGQALTRILRLEENEEGEMPLIRALAARRQLSGPRARRRADEDHAVVLGGDPVTAPDGSFAGFRGTAAVELSEQAGARGASALFDHALDEVLRSPLDSIIASAEQIVERADGPLRSDYASYGNDIAAAARHLLSVLTAMSEETDRTHSRVDLGALAAEAVVMLESTAEERRVEINLEATEPLGANGEERAVIQILVNLITNAIRYSPEGGAIHLSFSKSNATASVTVSDQGPGIAQGDQQRIFERFERAQTSQAGTGLGLAISRRLARSMGGDVTLDSTPGAGARFTLTLPSA